MNVAVFSQVSEMVRALWGPLIKSLVQTEFLFSYSISFRVPRFYRTGPVGVLISLSVQSVCSWFVLSGKTSCCKVSSGVILDSTSCRIFVYMTIRWYFLCWVCCGVLMEVSVRNHSPTLPVSGRFLHLGDKKTKDPVSSQGYCHLELYTLHMFNSLCSASKLCLKS